MLKKIHPGIKLWVTKILYQKIFPRGNIFLIHFILIYWVVFWGKYFWTVSSMLSYRRSTQRGDEDGGIEDIELTFPHEHIKKIYLYLEQLLLKTNWHLTERLLYNKGCKNDIQGIRQEEKGRDQVGIGTPMRAHKREDCIDWVQSLGSEMLKSQARAIGSATG